MSKQLDSLKNKKRSRLKFKCLLKTTKVSWHCFLIFSYKLWCEIKINTIDFVLRQKGG